MRPGTRLRSAVDDTELIVVRGSDDDDIDLRCGGHPIVEHSGGRVVGVEPDPAHSDGTQVGKRYTDAAANDRVAVHEGRHRQPVDR